MQEQAARISRRVETERNQATLTFRAWRDPESQEGLKLTNGYISAMAIINALPESQEGLKQYLDSDRGVACGFESRISRRVETTQHPRQLLLQLPRHGQNLKKG
jgi:hypothetical protein